ncbi:MAG: ankyrin repeat domain-containing protein [Gammaproteobacteria bacterium]
MSSTRHDENNVDIEAFSNLKLSEQQDLLESQKDHQFLLALILFYSKKNPDFLALLRRFHDGTSDLGSDLISMRGPAWDKFLALDQSTGDQVFKEVLLSLIQKYDTPQIEALLKIEAHQKRIQRVRSMLNSDEQAKLIDLSSLKPDKEQLILEKMPPFVYFGGIDYEEGKLACAQIKHDKKNKAVGSYDFCPTLLEPSEFKSYLLLLKHSLSWPLRERFIITGHHWISGDIQIDAHGKTSILFLDSLGSHRNEIHDNTKSYIAAFDSAFPEQEIFFSAIKRQYSPMGCSVFALDDMQHLFTLERYLKDIHGKPVGLFDFLASQKNSLTGITIDTYDGWPRSVSMSIPHLPLSLTRTMQSRHIYNIIQERSMMEQETPINRKGETATLSVKKGFFSHSNERLNEKLRKLAEKIFLYLKNTDQATLKTDMEVFSLNHLLLSEVDQLKNKDPDDARESTACIMQLAILRHNNELIMTLLENTHTNPKDWINSIYGVFQFTPLTYAVKQNNVALIIALVAHGADPNQEDGHYRIPIKLAERDPQLIEALTQKPDTSDPTITPHRPN